MKSKRGKSTVSVYKASDGWRWHRRAPNDRITSESGEAYTSKANCLRIAKKLNPGCVFEVE